MITFGQGYIYYDGNIYKIIKPDTARKTLRWNLKDKKGNRHWVSQPQLEKIIKEKENDNHRNK